MTLRPAGSGPTIVAPSMFSRLESADSDFETRHGDADESRCVVDASEDATVMALRPRLIAAAFNFFLTM